MWWFKNLLRSWRGPLWFLACRVAVGEAPGLLGAVLLARVSGIEFNVSCRSRVADNAGEPDFGAFEGDAGVNARPEGT